MKREHGAVGEVALAKRHSTMEGEKSKRRKNGKAYSLGTKRVCSDNWSNVQSIAFSFALLSKRNGFCFWGSEPLPFGLFAFGVTCHMACSLLALPAIRLIRFGFICLLGALAFGVVRLSDTQPSSCPAPNS